MCDKQILCMLQWTISFKTISRSTTLRRYWDIYSKIIILSQHHWDNMLFFSLLLTLNNIANFVLMTLSIFPFAWYSSKYLNEYLETSKPIWNSNQLIGFYVVEAKKLMGEVVFIDCTYEKLTFLLQLGDFFHIFFRWGIHNYVRRKFQSTFFYSKILGHPNTNFFDILGNYVAKFRYWC